MGLLQNGQWVDQWYDAKSSGGRFERKALAFRTKAPRWCCQIKPAVIGLGPNLRG